MDSLTTVFCSEIFMKSLKREEKETGCTAHTAQPVLGPFRDSQVCLTLHLDTNTIIVFCFSSEAIWKAATPSTFDLKATLCPAPTPSFGNLHNPNFADPTHGWRHSCFRANFKFWKTDRDSSFDRALRHGWGGPATESLSNGIHFQSLQWQSDACRRIQLSWYPKYLRRLQNRSEYWFGKHLVFFSNSGFQIIIIPQYMSRKGSDVRKCLDGWLES